MLHFLKLVGAGLVGALAFSLSPIFPLYAMLPVALVVCALIIGSAIARDIRDARRGRAILPA